MHQYNLILSNPQIAIFDDNTPVTFTQEQMDAAKSDATKGMVSQADHDKAAATFKTSQTRYVEELNALKAKTTLTGEERTEMETRIEQLSTDLMTKEEVATQNATKATQKYETDLKTIGDDRDHWKKEYTESTIYRSITDAAVANKAINPAQLVSILRDKASLVDVLDSEGRPTGNLETRVKFEDTKDGQVVQLELTAADAMKRMTEQDSYLNLFQSSGTGGTGGNNSGGKKNTDIKSMSPSEYRKQRSNFL